MEAPSCLDLLIEANRARELAHSLADGTAAAALLAYADELERQAIEIDSERPGTPESWHIIDQGDVPPP